MAAGNFRLPSPSRRITDRFGRRRSESAQGLSTKQGWGGATNVWVDCRAFVWSYDGNVYDVTDDIISGSLSRNTDAPTNMTITIANEGDKYRQMFIPNDRIILWLRRDETEWQSFTGYIHNTPVFNIISHKEITLECSCIIRRLNQKFWDPAARENIFVLSSVLPPQPEGPAAAPEGTPRPDAADPAPDEPESETALANVHSLRPDAADPNSPAAPIIPDAADPAPDEPNEPDEIAPEDDPGGGEINTPDMTLAFLLTAPDHIGLKPESVLIQKFPDGWKERAAAITAQNLPCATEWKDLIICPDDAPGNCEEGGPGGTDGPLASGCPDGLTIGKVVEIWPESEREFAAAVLWCESRGDAGALNDTPEGRANGTPVGLFQFVPSTAQGVDPAATPEKLTDPLYNAALAKKLWDQDGWNQWECAEAHKGFPGADAYGHENDPITGCKEATIVDNMDINFQENAGEWLPHVQQVIDIVYGKFSGLLAPHTYPGHPPSPDIAVDFAMPSGWQNPATGSSLDLGNKVAGFLDTNWEAFNISYMIWQDQAKWSAGGAWEPYDEGSFGGGSGDPDSQRHLDHIHISFNPSGTVGKYVDDGQIFKPEATPCGSGGNGDAHSGPEPNVVDNAIERSLKGELNQKLSTMIKNSEKLKGISFTWGGGHGRNLEYRKSDWGVDASGLFNLLRKMQGIEPAEIGSVSDYFKFLEGVEKFDINREYPIGTILINPGSLETMGHMGMVVTRFGHVLEANATGRVMSDFKIGKSNIGWEGYTHVGYMPDIGRDENPMYVSHAKAEFDNRRHEVWLREYEEAQNRVYDEGEENPIIYCSTLPEDSGFVRIKEVNSWDTVGNDKKMYVRNRTKYASYINNGIAQWNGIGGVQILPSDGSRVDLDIYDGDRPDNVMATTSSAGWMEFDIARMDGATDNARQSVATHELGHALRLGHAPSSEVSVMQPIINSGSSNNPDSPTEYDVAEYKSVWGGAGQPGGGLTPEGGGPQTSDIEVEPCITRHPGGVYKLASNAVNEARGESTIMADLKRYLALTNGNMKGGEQFIKNEYPLEAYGEFSELWEPCIEKREWRHLAELNKESYMRTVQDIADAGMYTMMSIGTGEIVFWYPWFIGNIANDVALTEDERKEKEAVERADDRADDVISSSSTSLTGSLRKSPKQEIEDNKEFSGIGMGETNAHVLTDKFLLTDTDLIDFSLYVSDDALVTHYYVMGEYRLQGGSFGGIIDLQCWRWSTIFDNPVIKNLMKNSASFDPFAFIQRYGVRSKQETVKAIKIPGMAQIWADQHFIKQWLSCYMIQLKTTFLPELYPGTRIQIQSLGVECVVLQANHTFASEWSSQITVSMPLRITDENRIPPLPFWTLLTTEMVDEGLNPTRKFDDPKDDDLGVEDPFGTPLEISGDLWESIQRKRDADNERVRQYLEDWSELRKKGFLTYFDKQETNPDGSLKPPSEVDPVGTDIFLDGKPPSDELGRIYDRHPETRDQLEGLTRRQIKEKYPQVVF